MAEILDKLRDHSEVCRTTGNAGCISDRLAQSASEEIKSLRAILTEAIPFIGYSAHVPDILARAEAAVNYADVEKSNDE